MKDKNILITGGSSGIGKDCAKMLVNLQANVFLVARSKEKLCNVKDELEQIIIEKQFENHVYVVPYDLRELDSIQSIFDECVSHGDKLDGLVHSAGVNADCPIKVNSVTLMQEAMTVNCFSFAQLGRYFYSKKYSNDFSSVVAISSISSLLCEKGMAPYSASKAALNAYVKTMSKEFLRRNIRVNAILPAGVSTPMAEEKDKVMSAVGVSNCTKESISEQSMGNIPAEYVAKQVCNLLSNDSKYITGELVVMGAGRSY